MALPRAGRLATLVAAGLLCAMPAEAQRYREGRYPPRFPPEGLFDRGITFCRLMYDSDRGEDGGMGWVTDYPYAEINFMSRVAELTTTGVNFQQPDAPNYYVVRPTDKALFQCPFIMASDAGTAHFSPEEVTSLRSYLLKGGTLWVDDFWGDWAWEQFSREISKVLPAGEFPIVDVPMNDPMLGTLYQVTRIPQITSLQFWRRSGGRTTSERGRESDTPHLRAIRDHGGRIMVLMSHNTDIADSWERETEDIEFFYKFAHDGYAIGIDVWLHVMSH